jgi:molybdopterin-binding protein
MMVMLTQKSIKSIQNVLNETQNYLSDMLDEDFNTVSKGAYTQARANIKYTAFTELATDARDKFYAEYDYKTFNGYRLLAVDGSMVTLPNNEETQKEFSAIKVSNQYKEKDKNIVQGRVSVLYDVLNDIIIDSTITNSKIHEMKITINEHLKQTQKDDLIIFDRGYPSYEMFARIIHQTEADFLIRIKSSTYKKHTAVLFDKESGVTDIVANITPSTKAVRELCEKENLPKNIDVRFIQVILDDGEVEVLATSLLGKEQMQESEFKALYFKRWKIETYYDIMKNRLSLENFSGTTVLAIKQDFYATMFISNLESVLSHGLNEEIKNEEGSKRKIYTQKVNKAVSFNTIKNHAFDLFFFPDKEIIKTLDKIYLQLRTNLIAIRPDRHYDRPNEREGKNTRGIKSAAFLKRKKKGGF